MQGFKIFVLLAVVVVLLGLARAAPAGNEPPGLEFLAEFDGLEQVSAMLVRSDLTKLSAPAARFCNSAACRSYCRVLGWKHGRCVSAVRCRCFN